MNQNGSVTIEKEKQASSTIDCHIIEMGRNILAMIESGEIFKYPETCRIYNIKKQDMNHTNSTNHEAEQLGENNPIFPHINIKDCPKCMVIAEQLDTLDKKVAFRSKCNEP